MPYNILKLKTASNHLCLAKRKRSGLYFILISSKLTDQTQNYACTSCHYRKLKLISFLMIIQGVFFVLFFLMIRFECRRTSRLMKISTCGLLSHLEDMREFCLIYNTFMSDYWLSRKCEFLFKRIFVVSHMSCE